MKKKLKSGSGKKMHKDGKRLATMKDHDLSGKVKSVNGSTRMNGKYKKLVRLNIPGEGLQKFRKR
jgi:hypothetical protein